MSYDWYGWWEGTMFPWVPEPMGSYEWHGEESPKHKPKPPPVDDSEWLKDLGITDCDPEPAPEAPTTDAEQQEV